MLLSEKTIKFTGLTLCVLCFFSFYIVGERSQTKSQRRLVTLLTNSNKRGSQCSTEVKGLKGEMKLQVETEVRLAEDEGEALMEDNDAIAEENDEIKEENYRLEDQIDDLRDQLSEQDFVADTESEALLDLSELGNHTTALKEVLDQVEMDGSIKKGVLLERLIGEIKIKRIATKGCRDRLTGIADSVTEYTTEDHSNLVTDVFSEWDSYLKFKGKTDSVALTKAISEAAAANARNKAENDKKGIVEWDDFMDREKDIANMEFDHENEMDQDREDNAGWDTLKL